LPRGGSQEHDPHLAAVVGIVHHEDLWQLCRDELTGVDVLIDGWDIRGRWFGVVVGATPRTGELPRGETIPWRVIAAQIAPRGAGSWLCQPRLAPVFATARVLKLASELTK
jgi:hypothetical protein